ncbi:MAG: HK97 family phage prohead protease [bacterium]
MNLEAMKIGDIEIRAFPLTEIRVVSEEGQPRRIRGHAAVFNQLSEDLGWFREKIEPGAFANTIKVADVRALVNHDPNYVLGRNVAGTLGLAEDAVGLPIDILPPDTQWARDLMVSMERGDINQMSFGFRVTKERTEGTFDEPIRVLEEVSLFDVSVVTFPAYPQTTAEVRSKFETLAAQAGRENPEGGDEGQVPLDLLRRRLALER